MGAKCASLDGVRGPTWECTGAGPPAIRINYVISSSGGRTHSSASQLGVAAGGRVKNGDDFRRADKTLWLARTLARTHDLRRRRAESGHRARPWEGKGREGTEDAGETMQPGGRARMGSRLVDRRI